MTYTKVFYEYFIKIKKMIDVLKKDVKMDVNRM